MSKNQNNNIKYIDNSSLRIQYEVFGKGKTDDVVLPFSAFGFPGTVSIKKGTRDAKLTYKVYLDFYMCPTRTLFNKERNFKNYPLLTSVGYSCRNDFETDEEPIRVYEDDGWYEFQYKNGFEPFLIKNFVKMRFGNTYRKPIKCPLYLETKCKDEYANIHAILTMLDVVLTEILTYVEDIWDCCSDPAHVYYNAETSPTITDTVAFAPRLISQKIELVESCIKINIYHDKKRERIVIKISEDDLVFKKEFQSLDITAYVFIVKSFLKIAFNQDITLD